MAEEKFHLHMHAVRSVRSVKQGGAQVRMRFYDAPLKPETSPTLLGQIQMPEQWAWMVYKIIKQGASIAGADFSTSGNYDGGHPSSRPVG